MGVKFYLSNHSVYDRRKANVRLFKLEKKDLEVNKDLPKAVKQLLINEREQSLLQDVPKEKELAVFPKQGNLFKPFIFSLFTFLAISGIYFKPLSLGAINEFQSHQSLYSFMQADTGIRDKRRTVIEEQLNLQIRNQQISATEIYVLANQFKDIDEFFLASLLLKKLTQEFSNEIPLEVYAEYAQSLFFRDKKKFSDDVQNALTLALEKSPLDPIALTLKGIRYLQEGDVDSAMVAWEKAKANAVNEREKFTIQEAINTVNSIRNQ
tara:strand:- start:17720 stop:18517 length:798 start_codon:yes stop_codon:yes gene_type:complete